MLLFDAAVMYFYTYSGMFVSALAWSKTYEIFAADHFGQSENERDKLSSYLDRDSRFQEKSKKHVLSASYCNVGLWRIVICLMQQLRWLPSNWSESKSAWIPIWPSSLRWTRATPAGRTCPIISRSCSAALLWHRPTASWSRKWCCTRRASEWPRSSPARSFLSSRRCCHVLSWNFRVFALVYIAHYTFIVKE